MQYLKLKYELLNLVIFKYKRMMFSNSCHRNCVSQPCENNDAVQFCNRNWLWFCSTINPQMVNELEWIQTNYMYFHMRKLNKYKWGANRNKKSSSYEHSESACTRQALIQNQPSRLASLPTTNLLQTGQDKIMHHHHSLHAVTMHDITVDIKKIMIYVPLPLYPSYHSSVIWPSLDLTNEGSSLIWR